MKKLIGIIMLLLTTTIFASEDGIFGKWVTEKAKNGNQVIVNIYKENDGTISGVIEKLTQPVYTEGEYEGKEKMDLNNQDPNLRNRPLVGVKFVHSFVYDKNEDKYVDGKIYNPENGKTYYCYMKMNEDGTLLVKGSIDKSGFIGKKQIWHRYEAN